MLARAPNPRAALLKDSTGAVVGTTWGGMQCLFPLEPSKLVSFGDDGRETIIRCKICLGCREYERRRLAKRLEETYQDEEQTLWLVTVNCELPLQTVVAARLQRSRCANFEPAFYRLGYHQIALLAVGPRPKVSARTLLMRFSHTCSKISRSRGARAWQKVTAGIMESRSTYGEWTNRFYHRGLKRPTREFRFTKATRYTRGIAVRHEHAVHLKNARAWHNGVSIHLPEAIRPPKVMRRRGPVERRVAGGLSSIDSVLSALFSQSPVVAAPRSGAPTAARMLQPEVAAWRFPLKPPARLTGRDAAALTKSSGADGLILNQTRYSGSRHLTPEETEARRALILEQVRKLKDGGDG